MATFSSAIAVADITSLKALAPDDGAIRKVTEVNATYAFPSSFYVFVSGATYTEALPGIVTDNAATGRWIMFPSCLILSTGDASGTAAFPGITWVNTSTNARFISNPDLTWSAIAGGSSSSATTSTTSSYTQPTATNNVTINVGDSGVFVVDQYVFIAGGGTYQVVSIPGPTQLQVKNLGLSENAAPSSTIASPALITTTGRPAGIVESWTNVTTSTTLNSVIGLRYLIDASGGDITLTMPQASTMGDQVEHTIKRINDGGANTVTITLSGSDTFDGTIGDTSRTLAAKSQVILGNDGTSKILIG